MDRRQFVAETARAALGLTFIDRLPPIGHPPASFFRWERLRDDAWVVMNGGANVVVIRDPAGAIVIDSKVAGMGRSLRREIETRIGPIAAVLLTHHHPDHSGGYAALSSPRGIAHVAAVARLRPQVARLITRARTERTALVDQLGTSLARNFGVARDSLVDREIGENLADLAALDESRLLPAESFDRPTELRVGDTVLELAHAGPAHTDNDVFAYDRRRNLLMVGDLLFHEMHPLIDTSSGGTARGWQTALGDLDPPAGAETLIVPGHGRVGDRTMIATHRQYFERAQSVVTRALAAGRTRDEIVKFPNTDFPQFRSDDSWGENLGVVYDELVKK